MELHDLQKDPLTREIFTLLIVCNLPIEKKKRWTELLAVMAPEEKQKLRSLLKEEVDYELEMGEKVANDVMRKLEERLQSER